MSIVIAILVFGMIVLIHEIGHFSAARACGVLVEEFAIGMGPKLFSVQRGETVYSFRLLPIGGFCKMLGDETECADSRAFNNKKVSARILIISAGAILNFVLAFLVFSGLVLVNGMAVPAVRAVSPGTPAEAAGFLPGDRIVKLDDTTINIYEDLDFFLRYNRGESFVVTILRNGERLQMTVTPFLTENGYKMGFQPDARTGLFGEGVEGYARVGFFETVKSGTCQIVFYIKATVLGLVRLVSGQSSMAELAGPIGIVREINTAYEATIKVSILSTILTMFNIMGLLSATLGIFNLLPLPALDGGRLIFLFLEAIRRKPINAEREGMVHFVGFVLLMILAAFVAVSDILKFRL